MFCSVLFLRIFCFLKLHNSFFARTVEYNLIFSFEKCLRVMVFMLPKMLWCLRIITKSWLVVCLELFISIFEIIRSRCEEIDVKLWLMLFRIFFFIWVWGMYILQEKTFANSQNHVWIHIYFDRFSVYLLLIWYRKTAPTYGFKISEF